MSDKAYFRYNDDSPTRLMKVGDTITFQGHYKKRNLWEWLMWKEKELQEFIVVDEFPKSK